jgi:hypothetical protein
MQRRWRGNCHFRHNPCMSLCESKVLEHRMAGKRAELAAHSQHHGPRIEALKLDLPLAEVSLNPGQRSEKIVVPERAPEFTVGDGPKSDVFLPADYCRYLAILDRLEFIGGYFVSFPPGTTFFQGLGAQKAADMVGTERWSLTSSHLDFRASSSPTPPPPARQSSAVSPTARLPQAHCLLRWTRTRIAATGKADRARYIAWLHRSCA